MPTGNTQQVINYGASANDGQGDPLRTAFIKTDDNFDNVWLAGPVGSNVRITNNTIGVIDTNGNLILSPNGIGVIQTNNNIVPRLNRTYDLGTANLTYRTVYANTATFQTLGVAGDLSVGGNLTVSGNIIQVGNIVTETLTIQLANAAITANAANGSGITVGANDNIATLLYNSTGNVWTTNIGVSAVGNITGNYFIGNGSQLTGIASSYGNSNVTTLLGNLGSNVIGGTGNITTTANISGGFILGNVAFATGIPATYGNANVVANLAALGSNPINTTGNISGGNILTGGLISATGNVTGNYFIGNGSQLTGLSGNIANITANVITFNTSAGVSVDAGQMAWNSADGTLDIGLSYADVVLQVGQETHYVVRNDTGNIIENGTALYCSGVTAGSGRIEASPMTGSESPVKFLGLATQDISNGVNGVVTYFGYVRGLDTRGTANTAISVGDETWAVGDQLYVHPTAPGKLTKVVPEAPNVKICVASIMTRNQNSGIVFVRPTSNLDMTNLSDVEIDTPTSNQILSYDSNRWQNVDFDISVDTTPTLGGNLAGAGFSISNIGNITTTANITAGNVLTDAIESATDIYMFAGNGIVDIRATGNVVVKTDNAGHEWLFDSTGNLTVPGNIVMPAFSSLVGDGASPAPSISGFSNGGFGGNVTATGNVSGGNIITAGNISGNTAGYAIGYRDIPQVSFTGNATIATTDAGKHFYSTQSTDYILTIANNASQGFQVGAAITVVNQGTGNITIAQGSGVTLYLAGNATSGNRSVATFGMATIMKVATDTWFINGTGVS